MSRERRREMVDREHPGLSTVRQCALLGISRSSVYYRPRAPSQKDLALMKQIDQQYLATPFYGSRRMKVWLGRQGHWVNRKRVQRLMRTLGLQVIYRRPRTSKPAPGHKVYPYLLGGMEITGPNRVWAADITYIPIARGFLYLVASMDWYSRYVVAWRLSNTLDADFCVETLEEALSKGKPEVFNTDQGSQFTSEGFTELLEEHGVSISMDGKGRYTDNIFVERLWRTVKYEEVYLKAYSDGPGGQGWARGPTSTSTTPKGPTKPWATGHRRRCSAETRCNQMNSQKKGGGRQAEHWHTLERRRDPHL